MSVNSANDSRGSSRSLLRAVYAGVMTGLLFALSGAALSLHLFAERVLPHILTPARGIAFQEFTDASVVPRLLDWSYTQIGLLYDLQVLSPWLIIVAILLAVSVITISIRIINPTFHPIVRYTGGFTINDAIAPEEASPESNRELAADKRIEARTDVGNNPASKGESAIAGINATHITIDRVHLEQAGRVLLLAGLPVLAIWFYTGAFGTQPVIGGAHPSRALLQVIDLSRFIALGIGLFWGFSQTGLAGRFGILHQAYQSDDSAVPQRHGVEFVPGIKLAFTGVIFGFAMWAIEKCAVSEPVSVVLDRFQALGTFNRAYFSASARLFVGSAALVWFACGVLIYLLGNPRLRIEQRIGLALLPLLAAFGLIAVKKPLSIDVMAARFDTTRTVLATATAYDQKHPLASLPAGAAAAGELAQRAHVEAIGDKPPSCVDMVAFDSRGSFAVELDRVTDDGVITDHTGVRNVQSFLEQREYKSALSWVATKYMFNDANLRFDSTAEIRAGLNDLENGPHMLNMDSTVRSLFFICSPTPQNLALLDEYADESKFSHSTRDAQRLMGQLYTKFGSANKALYWFRKADMPRSFLQKIKSERPLYHAGVVTGKLTWNGAPLAHVLVGAAPQRLNGLPVDLQPQVLHYDEELFGSGNDASPYFPPYHPRPFRLRWICSGTTTAADGSFKIDSLTDGQYFLVCTLPEGVKLNIPFDSKLSVMHAPGAFALSYGEPMHDLGTIEFKYMK